MLMGGIKYMNGFGNHFNSEALPGALPVGQNSPQKVPYGLYAELLSGSAFTAPRGENRQVWLYRIRPSVLQGEFRPLDGAGVKGPPFGEGPPNPNPLRWDPLPMPQKATDFIEGLFTVAGNGDVGAKVGCAIHLYVANRSMTDSYLCGFG